MAIGGGEQIDGLFWELELRTQGIDAGAARAQAALKEIDAAAERTKRNVNAVGDSTGDQAKRNQAIADLNRQFAAGAITEAAYVEQSRALGVQLKTVSATAITAATAVAAEGTAAAGAAVATDVAAVSVRGLVAAFGPLAIAAIGIQLGARLITGAFNLITGGAREAKKATDDFIDSLLKQKQAAFDATLEGRRAITANALRIELAAQQRVEEIGPRTFLNRNVFAEAAAAEAKASAAVTKARDDETEAQTRLNKSQADEAQSHNQRIANLVAEGSARKDQTDELRRNAEQARSDLATLNSFSAAGAAARQAVAGRAQALSATQARDAVEAEQNRLGAIIKLQDDLDKKKEKTAATDAKAAGAQQSRFAALRDQMEALQASLTGGAGDDFEAKLKKIDDQIKDLKPTDPQLAILEALRAKIVGLFQVQNADALAKQLRDLTAASTVSAVDDLQNALADLVKSLEAKGAPQSLIDQVKGLQQPMIDATARSEELSKAIEGIQRDLALGFNLKFDLAAIQPKIDTAIAARNAAAPGTKAQAQAQTDLDKLLALEVELREKIRKLQLEALGKTEDTAEKTGRLAGNIAAVANAAFGVAAAFLGVDDALTKILGSIGQIAGGIQKISTATSLLDKLSGIGQVIGGGLQLGQLLFGDSPAEKARAQRTIENTEALRALTNRVGDIGKINVTGGDFARFTALLADPQFRQALSIPPGARPLFGGDKDINAALERFGFSAKEFADLARQFGVAVDASKISLDDVLQVQKAIKAAELTQFGDSFAGQMQEFEAEVRLFDLNSPTQQLAAFRKALDHIKDGGGILSKALANFDLSTAAGVEAAKKALQDLFTQFQALTPDQIPSFLGGLSPQDFLDAIEKWKDILNQATGGTTTTAGTGGFNVSTQITEVTGSRMAALLTTANVFAEKTAQNTAGILAQLLGEPQPPGNPPSSLPPLTLANLPPALSPGGPPVNTTDTPLLTLANVFAERTSIGVEGMQKLLAKAGTSLVNPPPVSPPAYTPYSGQPANNVTSSIVLAAGAVQVTLGGPVSEEQASAAGVLITESVVREMDRRLGGRAAWARRAAGDIRVT